MTLKDKDKLILARVESHYYGIFKYSPKMITKIKNSVDDVYDLMLTDVCRYGIRSYASQLKHKVGNHKVLQLIKVKNNTKIPNKYVCILFSFDGETIVYKNWNFRNSKYLYFDVQPGLYFLVEVK